MAGRPFPAPPPASGVGGLGGYAATPPGRLVPGPVIPPARPRQPPGTRTPQRRQLRNTGGGGVARVAAAPPQLAIRGALPWLRAALRPPAASLGRARRRPGAPSPAPRRREEGPAQPAAAPARKLRRRLGLARGRRGAAAAAPGAAKRPGLCDERHARCREEGCEPCLPRHPAPPSIAASRRRRLEGVSSQRPPAGVSLVQSIYEWCKPGHVTETDSGWESDAWSKCISLLLFWCRRGSFSFRKGGGRSFSSLSAVLGTAAKIRNLKGPP